MNMDINKAAEADAKKAKPGERFNKEENPKRTQAEMSLEFERLKAARICENLAGTVSYLYAANRMQELAELFAGTEQDRILMPYGIYRGKDAAKRCFVVDMVDLDDPDPARTEQLKGRMMISDFCTPIVEVAGDGKTAKGLWISPGLEAHRTADGSQGWWTWCKFAADFLLTEDGWKIWHLGKYLYFSTEYGKSWAKSPKHIFAPAQISADEPAGEMYYYTPDAVYPDEEPAIPVPYDTWTE